MTIYDQMERDDSRLPAPSADEIDAWEVLIKDFISKVRAMPPRSRLSRSVADYMEQDLHASLNQVQRARRNVTKRGPAFELPHEAYPDELNAWT